MTEQDNICHAGRSSYIAGPYRPTRRQTDDGMAAVDAVAANVGEFARCAAALLRAGVAPLNPVANMQWAESAFSPADIIAADLKLAASCEYIVLLDDWDLSVGARAEAAYCVVRMRMMTWRFRDGRLARTSLDERTTISRLKVRRSIKAACEGCRIGLGELYAKLGV